ncbi:MAG: thiamine phosphate synthase [Candidatus Aureabacteria bacterium]|nr:thiamine phosphate synthase [Candidatus Auribacterota bacterium]
MKIKGFYFITDSSLSKAGNESDVRSAVEAGVTIVQYRQKEASTRYLIEEATNFKKLCQGKALFLINDRVDVALAVDADGVHLGQDDMPPEAARKLLGSSKIIGVTVHNQDEAKDAVAKGADYLGVSPVFATSTKKDAGLPAGISLLQRIKATFSIPLVAIGGIQVQNAQYVVEAGADALCAISATVTKDNVKEEIQKFQKFFP